MYTQNSDYGHWTSVQIVAYFSKLSAMRRPATLVFFCVCFYVQSVLSYSRFIIHRSKPTSNLQLRNSGRQDDSSLISEIKFALQSRPDEEPLLFNLGMLLGQKVDGLAPGNLSERKSLIDEALTFFSKAVKINDKRDASWYNIASLKQQAGDSHGAMLAYRQTIRITESNDVLSACYSNLVQLLLEKGDLDEAAIVSNQAVNALPDDSTAWTNMGIVLRENQSYEWAVLCFENAVKFSDGINAVALNNLGNIHLQNNEADKAYSAYSRALQADPSDEASAYSLAMLLRDSGDQEASKKMFEQCVVINPANSAAAFQLAALSGSSNFEQCPSDYVADLFDHYAKKGYDTHMVSNLKYRVPDYLWDAFKSSTPLRTKTTPLVIVELGAGTGLVGSRFRAGLSEMSCGSDNYQVDEFTACDLSQEMIMRAYELMYVPASSSESSNTEAVTSSLEDAEQEENVYTDVVISDCTEYLLNRATQGAASADLILAGDVLVYIGNLDPLFSSVKASLSGLGEDSGRFIFSVEKLIGEDANGGFSLQESARFAHTKEYVVDALSKAGMEVVSCTEHPLRYDGGNEVNGYVFVAQKLSCII